MNQDLYTVLELPAWPAGKSATLIDIKRQFRKLALRYHPDKHHQLTTTSTSTPDALELAKQHFQHISIAYSILGDQHKRAIYDRTGDIDTAQLLGETRSTTVGGEFDWQEYFDLVLKPVTLDQIHAFTQHYRSSPEERDDILHAYIHTQGNMDQMLELILLSSVDDEPRYRQVIMDAIQNNQVPEYAHFMNDVPNGKKAKKRKTRAEREAKEAEEYAKQLGLDIMTHGQTTARNHKMTQPDTESGEGRDENKAGEVPDSLRMMIQKRSEGRLDALLKNLEAKYVMPKPKKSRTNKK